MFRLVKETALERRLLLGEELTKNHTTHSLAMCIGNGKEVQLFLAVRKDREQKAFVGKDRKRHKKSKYQ